MSRCPCIPESNLKWLRTRGRNWIIPKHRVYQFIESWLHESTPQYMYIFQSIGTKIEPTYSHVLSHNLVIYCSNLILQMEGRTSDFSETSSFIQKVMWENDHKGPFWLTFWVLKIKGGQNWWVDYFMTWTPGQIFFLPIVSVIMKITANTALIDYWFLNQLLDSTQKQLILFLSVFLCQNSTPSLFGFNKFILLLQDIV
jgi:hypothetical protein